MDAHLDATFDALFRAMDDWTSEASAGSLAEAVVLAGQEAVVLALLPDSPIPAYRRRLLARRVRSRFDRWYVASRQVLGRAGACRCHTTADRTVRAAFLMVNDLAVLLLREQLAQRWA